MRPIVQFLFAIIAFGISALGSPQDEWTFPRLPDKSSTVTDGEMWTFSWTSSLHDSFADLCKKCDPENVAVWLTGGGGSTYTKHLVSSSIDVVNSRSFLWTVNATGSAEIVYWVLRFTHSGAYVDGDPEVSSPIFEIKRRSPESSSTSQESLPSSTRVVTVGTPIFVPMTSSPAPEATQSNTPTSPTSGTRPSPPTSSDASTIDSKGVVGDLKSKLTTPQIAGIAAGGAILLIGLAFLAGCCYRRRKNKAACPENQNHQLMNFSSIQSRGPAPLDAVHQTSTRSRLTRPHAAARLPSASVTGSHTNNQGSPVIYDHPNMSHDTTRAHDSNTSLLPTTAHTPQDEYSSQESMTGVSTTEHPPGTERVYDTSSRSTGVPTGATSATGAPNALNNGRWSTNVGEYLQERRRGR